MTGSAKSGADSRAAKLIPDFAALHPGYPAFLDSLRGSAQKPLTIRTEANMFKDLFSLKGRVALVTGGSRGIGRMIAAGFLSHGAAKVYITARKAGPCEATARELTAEYGGECIALPIDISTMAGIGMLAAEIGKREPKLDILVNNAGAAWGADFDEFPESG
jgi:3-oxoacyl-ACP reductase-like protein